MITDPDAARRTAAAVLRPGDIGEVFAERRAHITYEVAGGETQAVRERFEHGMSLRRTSPDGTALSHVANLDPATLPALASALSGGEPVPSRGDAPAALPGADVLALAMRVDRHAQRAGGVRVSVKVVAFEQHVLIARPDRVVTELRTSASLHVRASARRGSAVRSATRAYGDESIAGLAAGDRAERTCDEAVAAALLRLDAVPANPGTLPVVLGPGTPAMLLHEACGHPLEADLVDRPGAAFRGRFGDRVASSAVTLVDDPGAPANGPQYGVDDEGEPARRAVLVEGGVLRERLTDRWHAEQAGVRGNAHGRRLGYAYPPLPRMAGTFVEPGDHDPAEIIAATPHGLYVTSIGGGDTDMGSGRFTLRVDEGHLIENGRLGPPVRGAMLSGRGSDVLAGIDLVGNDCVRACHTYVCNKIDQFPLLVNLGQPTIRVAGLSVWGG